MLYFNLKLPPVRQESCHCQCDSNLHMMIMTHMLMHARPWHLSECNVCGQHPTSCEKLTVLWLAFVVLAKTANVTHANDSATVLASFLGLNCQYAPPGPQPQVIDVADGKAALGWTIVAAVQQGFSVFWMMGATGIILVSPNHLARLPIFSLLTHIS